MVLVRARDLSKKYRAGEVAVKALKDFNFEIEPAFKASRLEPITALRHV
jgi:ABC-type dipeptide/oligopeptide/nickel transport system ATPase subunit